MVALIIIGIIVGIITLIMLIPVGADISYVDSELKVSAKACGVLMPLYPKPPEEKKPGKEKKPKKEKAKKPPEEKPAEKKPLKLPAFNKEELLELAKAGLSAAGSFGRKLKVDRFLLHYRAAGYDPYNTAMTYAYVNAALSTLAPICAKRFSVKDCSVKTDIDFTKDSTELDFGLAMTIRIGQMMGIGFCVGFKALGILMRNKKRLKAEEAANAAQAPKPEEGSPDAQATAAQSIPDTTENKDKINENIQAEERNDSNG